MKSGRSTRRALAAASLRNAQQLLTDAKVLRRRGSRGHSISAAVLAIEESAKAIINHFVAEGILRVVPKNPNHLTTFTARDLMDHRFKHAYLAAQFVDWLRYAPFMEALDSVRKDTLNIEEVRELMLRAVHAHRILQVDLAAGGSLFKEMKALFGLLENLNLMKNRGLYVDQSGGRLLTPRDFRTAEVERVLRLAEGIVQMATEIMRRGLSEKEKRLQIEANRRILESVRRAKKRASAPPPPRGGQLGR